VMVSNTVVIVSAARTPIGRYGGSFRNVHPAELGAVATRAAMARAGITGDQVDEVLMGHGRQAGSGPNPARQVGRRAGLPDTVPAQTINKACASGMEAVASAARAILLGESEIVVAGGIESMSRMPYLIDSEDARWGHKMGHFTLVDAMYRDGFTCSLSGMIMGETVELLSREYGVSRENSEAFAIESQRKAGAAIASGRFTDEIVPVTITDPKGRETIVEADEHPRPDTTVESLRKLAPVFTNVEGLPGSITAGTSSGITDGGAALVVMREDRARGMGLTPMARITGWASAGVDPRMMGIGPVPAMRKLFSRTGLTRGDFDLVELNEAFAAQVLAVLRDEPIAPDRLNVNGGAIALGHPIGCTGARIIVTLLHEMRKRGARRGLATLCVSGGMGMAMAFETME
ncbi:MAG TPA: acetyl-CoA C-acetyltransferase, partial [Vicinamibacterales bacterium]|nr:acetyl-CoA C-acetyltransferase [Vicinamibacterales bacterium]